MPQIHTATVHPLPSSILHNGSDVRRQYTRAAAKKAITVISQKFGSWKKRAVTNAPSLEHGMQGGH